MAVNLEWLSQQPQKVQEEILKKIQNLSEIENRPPKNVELVPIEIDCIVYYIPKQVSTLIDNLYQMAEDGKQEY